MSSLRKFIVIPLGVAVVLMGTIYFVFVSPYEGDPPPVVGKVQAFELINTDNKKFSQAELNKKVWVADFIFTSCGGVCPRMSAKMAELYRSYEMSPDVNFVSISVDPDVDTPERLKEYASRYKADTQKWHFLTGKYDDIRDIAIKSFKVGQPDEPIFHSQRFILVDQNHQIRGYYDYSSKEDMAKLFQDIALVLKES